MKTNAWLHVVTLSLVLVGAANWGLVGLFNVNLVESLFGMSSLTQIVYILVGLSAVYFVFTHKDECATCMKLMKKGK